MTERQQTPDSRQQTTSRPHVSVYAIVYRQSYRMQSYTANRIVYAIAYCQTISSEIVKLIFTY